MTKGHAGRLLLRAAIVVGALSIATAGSARPGREPLYNYHYFSDASHSTEVGFQAGVCYSFGPGVEQYATGQVTGFYELELAGWCEDGQTIYV